MRRRRPRPHRRLARIHRIVVQPAVAAQLRVRVRVLPVLVVHLHAVHLVHAVHVVVVAHAGIHARPRRVRLVLPLQRIHHRALHRVLHRLVHHRRRVGRKLGHVDRPHGLAGDGKRRAGVRAGRAAVAAAAILRHDRVRRHLHHRRRGCGRPRRTLRVASRQAKHGLRAGAALGKDGRVVLLALDRRRRGGRLRGRVNGTLVAVRQLKVRVELRGRGHAGRRKRRVAEDKRQAHNLRDVAAEVARLEHAAQVARRPRAPLQLLPLLLGPDARLPHGLDLLLAEQVLDLHLVLPVAHVKVVLKVLGNVLKVLVARRRRLLAVGRLEHAVAAGSKAARKDDLRAQVGAGRAVGEGLHAMRLLGVRAVRALRGKGQMAALGVADPDHVRAVKVVQVLLEVALAAKADGAAVQVAHGALVLFARRGDESGGRVRGALGRHGRRHGRGRVEPRALGELAGLGVVHGRHLGDDFGPGVLRVHRGDVGPALRGLGAGPRERRRADAGAGAAEQRVVGKDGGAGCEC